MAITEVKLGKEHLQTWWRSWSHDANCFLIYVQRVAKHGHRANRSDDFGSITTAAIEPGPRCIVEGRGSMLTKYLETSRVASFFESFHALLYIVVTDKQPATPSKLQCLMAGLHFRDTHPGSKILGADLNTSLIFAPLGFLLFLW